MKILTVLFFVTLISAFLIGFYMYKSFPQEMKDTCSLSDTCEDEVYPYLCSDGNYFFYLKEESEEDTIKCGVRTDG